MNPSHTMPARLLASGLAALLLAGCAGTAPKPAMTPEEQVSERARERWDLLLEKRFTDAWAYLSPGARQAMPADRYETELSNRPVRWTGAEILKVECELEASCKATVRIDFEVRSHLTGVGWLAAHSAVSESWINLDGAWYHVPEHIVGR